MELVNKDDCFSNLRQEFLVCTTVHKARHLGTFNGEVFIRVIFDKIQKSTRVVANSENPFFNEYFVFEVKTTLNELLRKTVFYEVIKRVGCCKRVVLGELHIDLQSVWLQPNRYFFKKWGRFESILVNNKHESQFNGYLQLDLAIITSASNTDQLMQEVAQAKNSFEWEQQRDYDDIKKNMITEVDPKVECNIKYTVSFFNGVFVKKAAYFVQFVYYPFKVKTKTCKSSKSPQFNEFSSFTWVHPTLTQNFIIQIFTPDFCQSKCIGEVELHLNEIAFRDKPKLGPTYLHFYEKKNPSNYIGRLLLELRSECLTNTTTPREVETGKVSPADEKRWWQDEIFSIEFLALYGDFLHGNFDSCKLSMKFAEHTSRNVEFSVKTYQSSSKVEKQLKYFNKRLPFKALSIVVSLPDNRHKYDSDYFLQEIIDSIATDVEAFKLFQLKYTNHFQIQNKCLKNILQKLQARIREGLTKRRLQYTSFKDPTPWDINRLFYLQEIMRALPEEMQEMIYELRKTTIYTIQQTMSDIVRRLIYRCKDLSNITYTTRVQDNWPDLYLVLSEGGEEFALCHVDPKLFINTPANKQISPINVCWQVRRFIFKDIKCRHMCTGCGCIAAVVQGCLGIVAESEHAELFEEISEEWRKVEEFLYTPAVEYTPFKLRIFVYQAKVRPGHDKTGLCDGVVRILFHGQTAETKPVKASLSPIWNSVLSFECIRLPGSIEWYYTHPPVVAVEFYDLDKHTAEDYLGCGLLAPSVISRESDDHIETDIPRNYGYWKQFLRLKELSPPPLKWLPMAVQGTVRAEVLISAELIKIDDCDDNIKTLEPTISLGLPKSIRPNIQNFVLEVVFVGFRNYTKFFSGKHLVKLMMGDLLLYSGLTTSKMKNSINFLLLYSSGVASLPEQLEYWPAIVVTDVIVASNVVSKKLKETTVGAMLIPDSKKYLQSDKFIACMAVDAEITNSPHTTVLAEGSQKKVEHWGVIKFIKSIFHTEFKKHCEPVKSQVKDKRFTWWTKFYNSEHSNTMDFNSSKHSLTIFNKELERYPEYSYFHDWAEPIFLVHGVKFNKNAVPKEETYATLKIKIKVTPCLCNKKGECTKEGTLKPLATALNPRYQAEVQHLAELSKIFVRVYVVQGLNLRPRDKNRQSDPYVKARLGNIVITNRAHFIPNQSNPIFGKLFELQGILPREHLLEISVYDKNAYKDELIGSTIIDLEDRWRTQHRATVGLPKEYSAKGYNKWRDIETPMEILSNYCVKNKIESPTIISDSIKVDGLYFKDETLVACDEDVQERLCLTVLRNFEKLPTFGYKLLPEHVETRSLYRENFPGIEQGKVQLWVEIFDANTNIPPPVDITPEPPKTYELRVIVHNCSEIVQDDTNIFGLKMSDIYVTGWCDEHQKAQFTDVHYRSLNGEGQFNWRMIFEINFSETEGMMLTKHKAGVFDEYESKQPPVFHVQVWDNDVISNDDFLGALEINLSNFPEPYSLKSACNSATLKFERGWRRYDHYKVVDDKLNSNSYNLRRPISLFDEKSIRGWFPLRAPYKKSSQNTEIPLSNYAGKIELELKILTPGEAKMNPAGLGRDEPNALPPPNRPDTSFHPLKDPWKSCTLIIWPVLRRYGFIILAAILLFLIVFMTILNLPYLMFVLLH